MHEVNLALANAQTLVDRLRQLTEKLPPSPTPPKYTRLDLFWDALAATCWLCLGVAAIAMTVFCIRLIGKLNEPPPAPAVSVEEQKLRWEWFQQKTRITDLEEKIAEQEKALATKTVTTEVLPPGIPPEDMIPPQNVPTTPTDESKD